MHGKKSAWQMPMKHAGMSGAVPGSSRHINPGPPSIPSSRKKAKIKKSRGEVYNKLMQSYTRSMGKKTGKPPSIGVEDPEPPKNGED